MSKFTLDKDEAILMVIDIQERLVPAVRVADQVIDNTNILISAAKEFNMPIIVTEQYPRGLGSTVGEIKDRIDLKNIFEKTSFSAYTPEVEKALNQSKREKIIITGMETHVCVFQTIRDLIGDGYEVFVAADAVSSRTLANYSNGLSLIEKMGAVISNTETIVFDLLKVAGTPEFKVLSKLIK